MSRIVVLGAGLGGVIMAREMMEKLRPEDELTVVNFGSTYSFVPSKRSFASIPRNDLSRNLSERSPEHDD